MNTTAPETGGFAYRMEAGNWLPIIGAQHTALKVSLNSTQAFAGKNEFADRNQWPGFGIKDRLEFAGTDSITAIGAEVGNTAELIVVIKSRAAGDHLIPVADGGFHLHPIEAQAVKIFLVHAVHQLLERVRDNNIVRAFANEALNQLFVAKKERF